MSNDNKIFTRNQIVDNSYQKPRVTYNRDYLITQSVSRELNTYNYFGIFRAYNDIHEREIDPKSPHKDILDDTKVHNAPAVRSLFNRAGAMMVGGTREQATNLLDENTDLADRTRIMRHNASEWRVFNNVPLIDSPENRRKQRAHGGCSVKELVQQSSLGLLGRAIYSYADFMYCKYLGRVPNNYLITLRRFGIPPGDNITSSGTGQTNLTEAGKNNFGQHQGCLVTWLGTPGNEMENILKYSVTMPYQEKRAKLEDASSGSADTQSGMLNSIAAAFDPKYREQYTAGYGGAAFNSYIGKFFGAAIDKGLHAIGAPQGDGQGPYQLHFEDGNKVYGPIDRVKTIYMRGDEGIDFKQDITLTFDYELRSYNGINGRQAFLDLIANILNVTYTTGSFWGGGYKGGGMHQNSIFANLNIFKAKGGFTNFMDAFAQDLSNGLSAAKETFGGINSIGDVVKLIGQALNSIGGMFLGSALNKLGRPARTYANSLLSEQPTGMWHVMIGNPKHPIMSMGNMVLKETTIQHYGPLGIDDFPTGIRVVCQLTRGKGRDNRNIELLYMHGNDRIYSSMSHKVLDMYKNAQTYNDPNREPYTQIYPRTIVSAQPSKYNFPQDGDDPNETVSAETETPESPTQSAGNIQTPYTVSAEELKGYSANLLKYFGESDTYSIIFAAAEQENGGNPVPQKNDDSKA